MKRLAYMLGCLAIMATAAAYTFDDLVFEGWFAVSPGHTDNQAVTVFDFGGGNTYAFGYTWNDGDTITRSGGSVYETNNPTASANFSEVMLLTFDAAANGLDVAYHYHDSYGFGVDGFSYQGNEIVGDNWITTYPGLWWDGFAGYSYWDFLLMAMVAVPGEPVDGSLLPAGVGVSTRELQDGFWDAWTQEQIANGFDPIHTPALPLASIPEPTTAALLGLAVAGLLARRR